jgi:5-methylcytosine-specific restriction endonuclease McrA
LAHDRILTDLPLSKKRFYLESPDFQAVRDGGDDQDGRRQSMPSHSIASCAAVKIARFCSFDQNRRRSRPAKISTRAIRPDRSVAKYEISDVTSGQCRETKRLFHRTLT